MKSITNMKKITLLLKLFLLSFFLICDINGQEASSNKPDGNKKSVSTQLSIAPDGNIILEASIFNEDIIKTTLDLSKSNRANALKSIKSGILKDWWIEGMEYVRIIK